MTRYTSLRQRMMMVSPHCHWCKKEVFEIKLQPNQKPPDDMATIDHTISRFFRKKGTKVRKVLACYKCNTDRAKQEDKIYGLGAIKKINNIIN